MAKYHGTSHWPEEYYPVRDAVLNDTRIVLDIERSGYRYVVLIERRREGDWAGLHRLNGVETGKVTAIVDRSADGAEVQLVGKWYEDGEWLDWDVQLTLL